MQAGLPLSSGPWRFGPIILVGESSGKRPAPHGPHAHHPAFALRCLYRARADPGPADHRAAAPRDAGRRAGGRARRTLLVCGPGVAQGRPRGGSGGGSGGGAGFGARPRLFARACSLPPGSATSAWSTISRLA